MDIVFVKTAQALLVGVRKDHIEGVVTLEKPRMVFADQSANTINLAPMLGGAYTVDIKDHDYMYNATDEEFIKFYTQETTTIPGLTIVK